MKSILIVDDEIDIREATRAILEDEGYWVDTCGNGVEALSTLSVAKTDLAIIDLMMPRMNGLETIEELSRREGLARLPVILMSAINPTATGRWRAFLKKPFSLEQLLTTVRGIIGA